MNLKGFTQLTCSQSHLWGEKATLGLFLVHFLDDWPVRASKWCRYRASRLKPKSLCKGTVKLKLFYTVTTDLVWAVQCSAATTAIFLLCHKPGRLYLYYYWLSQSISHCLSKNTPFLWHGCEKSHVVKTHTILRLQYLGWAFWCGSLKHGSCLNSSVC